MPALISSSVTLKPKLSTLTFVTSNADKIREVTAICKEYGIRVEPIQSIDLPELQGSIEEVAREKCRQAALASLGLDGLNRLLAGHVDKSAAAVCTFAFSWGQFQDQYPYSNDQSASAPKAEPPEVFLFQGRNEGRIVPERGEYGFAFDPIFEYEGKTYSELRPESKNRTSDRFKGLIKFLDWLAN
ncbi:hypothetical protein UA08_03587 [Talaromyces atroroseus]|uniref:Inosine triphosphate pyrophosphatase n=1 Tax=Talaromyces atroroseus TaxID=1441469 RepID=A0A225B1P9_TALAT|nr:hypothetical protein UA08_03587 [Talaromyces atroroseus]OKL61146.1 hypothetical protein UA08_03587 [Talaromyces atroroseus]